MGWSSVLFKLTPVTIDLVNIAEEAFDGQPKAGAEKKAFVLRATKDILKAGTDISTGEQKETWEIVDKVAPGLVDAIARFFFP